MPKLFTKVLFFCSALFLIPASAQAATYYVSTSGSDSNAGSSSAPFKTIQKAANIVNPGDTVIVRDGTYTDTNNDLNVVRLARGGTSSSSWITFKAENKWGAVLDGLGTAKFGWNLKAGSQYIRIEGFQIKNMTNAAFVMQKELSNHQNNIYIYRNKIYDIGRQIRGCSDPEVGIGHSGIGASYLVENLTVDSNEIYDIGRLSECKTKEDYADPAKEGKCGCSLQQDYSLDHGIYVGSQHTKIINNVFYNCAAGWSIQVAGSVSPTTDWKIINNTFYGKNPVKVGQIVLWGYTNDITIQNNISHSAQTSFIHALDAEKKKSIKINNNLVYGAEKVINTSGAEYQLSDNITGKDPKLVDLASRNFRLQSTSPAIDKGLYTSDRVYDADGKLISGTPDIGAYEYGSSGSGDTTPPAPPTGLKVQ